MRCFGRIHHAEILQNYLDKFGSDHWQVYFISKERGHIDTYIYIFTILYTCFSIIIEYMYHTYLIPYLCSISFLLEVTRSCGSPTALATCGSETVRSIWKSASTCSEIATWTLDDYMILYVTYLMCMQMI